MSSEGSSGSGRLQLSISGTSRGGESQGPDQVGVRSEVAETRQTSTGRPLRECREKVLFDFILCPKLKRHKRFIFKRYLVVLSRRRKSGLQRRKKTQRVELEAEKDWATLDPADEVRETSF